LQGAARRRAVEMGLQDYSIHYTTPKKAALQMLLPMRPLFVWMAKRLPNSKKLDYLYQKNIHLLYALDIFDGYVNYKP
jgi:hypothetical protein